MGWPIQRLKAIELRLANDVDVADPLGFEVAGSNVALHCHARPLQVGGSVREGKQFVLHSGKGSMHRLNDNTLRLAHRDSSWYNHNMLQTAQAMGGPMIVVMAPERHCATCRCMQTIRLESDPAWDALMARRAESDAEIEAMFAEAERLLEEGAHHAH